MYFECQGEIYFLLEIFAVPYFLSWDKYPFNQVFCSQKDLLTRMYLSPVLLQLKLPASQGTFGLSIGLSTEYLLSTIEMLHI